jgi:putative transposase
MNRKSIRLHGFDYTTHGAYFITICSHQREHLFGTILEGQMQPNGLGTILLEEWNTTGKRPNVVLDEFVTMPNHIHGILWIVSSEGADTTTSPVVGAQRAAPLREQQFIHSQQELMVSKNINAVSALQAGSLGAIVRGYKSAVTKQARILIGNPHLQVWQRNYFERVIRNERELNAVREYIALNPQNWLFDLEASSDVALHDCVFSSLEAVA